MLQSRCNGFTAFIWFTSNVVCKNFGASLLVEDGIEVWESFRSASCPLRPAPSPNHHLEITNYSDSRRRSIPLVAAFSCRLLQPYKCRFSCSFLWHVFSEFRILCFRSMKCIKWIPNGLVAFCSQLSSSKLIGSTDANTLRLSEIFCLCLLNWAVRYEVKWCRLMSCLYRFAYISLQ